MTITVHLSRRPHELARIDLTRPRPEERIFIRGIPLLGSPDAFVEKPYEEALFFLYNGRAPGTEELARIRDEVCHGLLMSTPITNELLAAGVHRKPLIAIQILMLSLGYGDHTSDFALVAQSFVAVANLFNQYIGRNAATPDPGMGLVENLLHMIGKDPRDARLVRSLSRMMLAWVEIGAGPPSVVATRVNASSRTDRLTAIAAGVGNATGERHTSARIGASRLISRIIDACAAAGVFLPAVRQSDQQSASEIARAELQEQLDRREIIPGFGHWIFKGLGDGVDPRIRLVEEAISEASPNSKAYCVAQLMAGILERGELKRNGRVFQLAPNSDLYWAAFLHDFFSSYGEPSVMCEVASLLTILARIGGLIAHDREQRLDSSPLRSFGNWITPLKAGDAMVEKRQPSTGHPMTGLKKSA